MTHGHAFAPMTTVGPSDQRYPALSRGFNQRWIASPDYVRLVGSPAGAVRALSEAVNQPAADPTRTRITVRSGGHCYEDFVCGDDVRVILDVSPLCGVYYDPDLEAHCVEAGASTRHVYGHLYPMSGKVVPGGSCHSVGLGGHVTGGGFGLLSRQYGLTVDYLYAVEVAVVRPDRTVGLVVATRDEPRTDLHDLLWAHTGGGGGNFGLVTRFWFRDLPEPPRNVRLAARSWAWSQFDRSEFARLVTAFGAYFRDHQDPDEPSGTLFAMLKLNHVSHGRIGLLAQINDDDPGAAAALNDFLDTIDDAIEPTSEEMTTSMGEHPAVRAMHTPRVLPWLTATRALDASEENRCGKYKSAYLRTPLTAEQIDRLWAYLGNVHYKDYVNERALIQIDSYGSAINRPAHDTATAHRDSIMTMQFQVYWQRSERATEIDGHTAWIRDVYRKTFADTGGVPAIGEVTDGCYINYPDTDLSSREWNTSTDPWHKLYYKDAYRRLQQVKRCWDPLDVFRHRQSVRLPKAGEEEFGSEW